MAARHPAHTRHSWHRWRYRTWSQIDDPLAVGTRTCNSLWRALANKQTIAGATHILLPRRGIPYGLVRYKVVTEDPFFFSNVCWTHLIELLYQNKKYIIANEKSLIILKLIFLLIYILWHLIKKKM